ncbi:hypothetical protein Pony_10 [Bacillus phage Pony]|uniref:Uncharacterized protein n=1 Tax=Bacillus phage Pony TaxID=1406789 RepID=U5PWV6_9CAUD|nr:tail protein [Bacillus phage Pony]AGY48251.1 hypothetical protein Pony_10 [Bacillus phage Pony]
MLYPKKNLIPPLKDYDFSKAGSVYTAPPGSYWLSSFAPSQTDYVTFKSEYYFETTASGNNRDVIVLVPAKPNTAYKPSCDTNADIHLMYYDDKRAKITQTYNTISANVAGVTPAGCAFIGFVLTNRGLGPGTYYFKNWQLEEVATATSPATPFEPYQLTNKRAAVRKDVIAPDIQGTSHNFVSGNLYKVKQDVRLTKAKFESLTAGTFNVAIYEWVEGTGKVGQPLFMRDAEYGIGVYSYDFGGIILKAGKTYFIGRYEQTNAAAIKRITGGTINVGNYVEWVGGTTLSQTTTIYPTSYYSFFAIEFELVNSAKLISDGALNVPLTSDLWVLRSGTTYKRFEGNRVYWNSNADYAGIQLILANMGYKDSDFQGKDIVFGGDVHPLATVMFYYKKSDGSPTYIGVSKVTDNGARAMTIPYGSTEHRIYVQSDAGGRGELWCENVYVKFGTEKGIKPYNPTNKKALMYISKNFFNLDAASWTQGVRQGNKSIQASAYRITYIGDFPKVIPGQNFVMDFPANVPGYGTGHKFGVFIWDKDGNVLLDSGWQYSKYEFTIPPGGYEMSLNMGLSNDGSLTPARASATQMVLYDKNAMTNKKAVLYPQKNLFTFEGCKITSGGGSSFTVISPNEVIVSSVLNAFTAIETAKMTVKPNTQYTISYEVEHITGIDPPRVSPRKGSDRSGITLTDGAGSKTMTFNTGSETEIYFLLYANLADVSAPQSNRYKRVQVEEGTQTPFELYRLGNKRA